MLYPRNTSPTLSAQLFLHPTSEYRGTPFWAWNGKLCKEELGRQIDIFQKMGLGGFHMHVRTGMDTPYLSAEFMDFVRFCTEKAKEKGMLAWLYDEDRWPSGTAGGKVTAEHPEFAKKTLLFTTKPYGPDGAKECSASIPGQGNRSMRLENGVLLAVYDVVLHPDGTLFTAKQVQEGDPCQGTRWYAYREHASFDPWFNDQPYVDTLNPAATDAFLQTTHEAYAREFSEEFGKTIPAIFTDEPQFTRKAALAFAQDTTDVFLPWTDDLPILYKERYGEDLFATLPQLVWQLPNRQVSPTRYRFHNLVADCFRTAFCKRIGDWCTENGILLTGHVMEEPTLGSQTQAVGDAMRCYPHFGLPGIDMLCDFHEYNTAKQTQSMVRQQGAPGMLSELYGVTGWDYDFRGYKLQGDWQAALGVTVRVPHLTWMTMQGEAKRDYPASIGYQSPWWEKFSLVEDHFARLNTALTRGKAHVRVAVVHPIESYWLHWGPSEQTVALRNQMEEQFSSLTETLLFGLIDFDFLCEATLPEQNAAVDGSTLCVGEMRYDTVIVSGVKTLRRSTLSLLSAFRAAGGKVIFIGDCPDHVDALPTEDVHALYASSLHAAPGGTQILDMLSQQRLVDIHDLQGNRPDHILYQMRRDGDVQWLFFANGKNPVSKDVEPAPTYRFSIEGLYAVTEYDTWTGEIRPLSVTREEGKTIFHRTWHLQDSLLLMLTPTTTYSVEETVPDQRTEPAVQHILHPVEVTLEEPNMLLLDMAEWALDEGPWQPLEELLRIDNKARAQLGIPLRRKEIVQPYCIAPEASTHVLHLRCQIPCAYAVDAPLLALEMPQEAQIVLDGHPVDTKATGFYVDRAIQTIPLPSLSIGTHTLLLTVPIGTRTNLECFYLLGDFGVEIKGVEKTIVPPVRVLGFGDIVPQGLPFYTGNVLYHCDIQTKETLTLRVPHYRGGLVEVLVDGKEQGSIVTSPYTCTIKGLRPGLHRITLKLYGVRQNGFAQLHHTPGIYFYQSPNSWRSDGDLWTYEYQFKPMGILKSPEFHTGGSITGASITDTM